MENSEIADILEEISRILEFKGENTFRIRAYQRAAQAIESTPERIEDLWRQDKSAIKDIPDIGESMAEKIGALLSNGKIEQYEKLKREVPSGLIDMMSLEGLGPKKLKKICDKLDIRTLNQLKAACQKGKLRDIPGLGQKTEENILDAMGEFETYKDRFKLSDADSIANSIVKFLKKETDVGRIEIAGSLRRGKETIGDIDILFTARNKKQRDKTMDALTHYTGIKRVLVHGEAKTSVVLKSNLHIDLRSIEKNSFGAASIYFTGSKAHNIALRKLALSENYKVNEYGVFKGKKRLAGKTEEGVYKRLGLSFIPPELREARGEIEKSREDKLPKLIKLSSIKGDLQMHTRATDGKNTIKEMAETAKSLGYQYIAITDHSKAVRVAGGLNEKDLAKHFEEIDRANEAIKDLTILKGIEVDILNDGTLDLKDDILKDADVVMAAVHSRFKMSEEKMTERILRAFDNTYVNCFAHPTGRLIGIRKPYQVNIERILRAAKDRNIAVEINSQLARLDLNDIHTKLAKEIGALIAVNTDAHSTVQLENMRFGVITARRGWLEKKDVINTYSLLDLRKFLFKRRG